MTTIEIEDRADFLAQRRRTSLVDIASVLLTILAALAIAFVIIALLGKNPVDAFAALLGGPFERPNRIGRWIEDATTLAVLGLSVMVPFRAGQISIGAEGQLYLGVLVGGVAALSLPLPPVLAPVALTLLAMLGGAAAGAVPGIMKARFGANEIVATLMLNVIIVQLFDYVVQNQLRSETSTAAVSDNVPQNSEWLRLADLTGIPLSRANVGILVALVATAAVWFVMTRTTIGYRMRAVGANTDFAAYGGVPVARTIEWSFVLGGAIAGLAGAHLLFGAFGRLEPGMASGLGFLGIVIALVGRNNPVGVLIAAAFYAFLRVGGDAMEQQSDVGSEIVIVIQAIIVLLVTARALPLVIARFTRTKETR